MTAATLFIIAAPSGAGKTSLVNALIESMPDIVLSISYTTRPKRSSETDGIHYRYVSEHVFNEKRHANDFLEHANVFDHLYGTSQSWIQEQLNQNNDVILEIDWQGAQQINQKSLQSTSIFIFPPSRATLLQRLQKRGQDSPEVIQKRTQAATLEMSHYDEFDYLIVNDDFNIALHQLKSIILAKRLTQSLQANKLQPLIADLLHPLMTG